MSGICDRCNERASQLVSVNEAPELASVAHLGYRMVCTPCYDDLVAEASDVDERDEDRRAEPRVQVAIKAQVDGNTSHMDAFSDEMLIEEISPSGLRLRTTRQMDPGTILKVSIPSRSLEATALVQVVWNEAGQHSVGLKLVEPSDSWRRLCEEYMPR